MAINDIFKGFTQICIKPKQILEPKQTLRRSTPLFSKFIWNDKCPRIKLTTLQHPNSTGGLAVPNFELYYWSFQLKALHNWFDLVFLQLRSALKAYGVPWSSSISSHPMRDWIAPSAGRPSVSLIYNKIIDCITKPLSIKTIWNSELSDLNLSVDWERVWSNLSLKGWLIAISLF